jgi:hypothetical protein
MLRIRNQALWLTGNEGIVILRQFVVLMGRLVLLRLGVNMVPDLESVKRDVSETNGKVNCY